LIRQIVDPSCITLGLLSVPVGYVLVRVALISHLKVKSPRDLVRYLMTRDIGNLHADLLDEEGNELRKRFRIKAPFLF